MSEWQQKRFGNHGNQAFERKRRAKSQATSATKAAGESWAYNGCTKGSRLEPSVKKHNMPTQEQDPAKEEKQLMDNLQTGLRFRAKKTQPPIVFLASFGSQRTGTLCQLPLRRSPDTAISTKSQDWARSTLKVSTCTFKISRNWGQKCVPSPRGHPQEKVSAHKSPEKSCAPLPNVVQMRPFSDTKLGISVARALHSGLLGLLFRKARTHTHTAAVEIDPTLQNRGIPNTAVSF